MNVSSAGSIPAAAGMSVAAVEVAAVVVWRAEDSDEDHRGRAKCEAWEVVVPEIVYR